MRQGSRATSKRRLHVAEGNGRARLVGGSADADGAWEYGIIEVLVGGVYSVIDGPRSFGRRGAQVACRSLGFATGAQLIVGRSSPLPAPLTSPTLIDSITCDGSEASLADCDIRTRESESFYDYGFDVNIQSVALLCTTPSGAPDTITLTAAMRKTRNDCSWLECGDEMLCLKAVHAWSLDCWPVAGMKCSCQPRCTATDTRKASVTINIAGT